MSTCTSTDSLRVASRCRRNTSGPNKAGSVTVPSARSRPRNVTPSSQVLENGQESNHRCWRWQRHRLPDCVRTHTHPRLVSLNIAVLDLPLLPILEQEGGLSFLLTLLPKSWQRRWAPEQTSWPTPPLPPLPPPRSPPSSAAGDSKGDVRRPL